MHKLTRIVVFLSIIPLLSSCNYHHIIEELAFTQAVTFDMLENHDSESDSKLKISISYPNTYDQKDPMARNYLTATASIGKEGRIILARQTELKIVSGQMRSMLYGKSLAEKGIWKHIETTLRDSSISPRVKIIIVDGDASKLLSKDYPPHPRTSQYIHRLVNKESVAKQIPRVTLYEFSRDYFDDGIDPYAPIIKDAGENLIISGIALFLDGQYTALVKPDQATLFNIMRGNISQGEIIVDLSKKEESNNSHLLLGSITSKRKIKVTTDIENNQYHIHLDLRLKGSILEYSGNLQLDKKDARLQLERNIAESLQEDAEKLMAYMQKHKVDNIGLGKKVRNSLSYRQWKDLDWREVYPNVKIKITTSVKIRDYGSVSQ